MIVLIIGSIGINRLKGTMPKLLSSSLLDTMGFILLVTGLLLKTGFLAIGIRLIIVLIFVLLKNTVINHIMTKEAFNKGEGKDD
jgi:multicomponent Na+:H+ antiporter subunit G